MTDDRTRPLFQAGSPAHQRLLSRIDEGHTAISERVEAGFDRVIKKMERMERDIAKVEQSHGRLTSDFLELKRDVGELRDAANMGADKAVAEVRAGAPAKWHKTVWGRVIIAASGFTTLMIAADNVPDAARGWEKFWTYLRNDPPGLARASEAE